MVRCARRRPGFTLSQLLVLLALLGILLGLLFPALVKVREAAARAECQNNLKQIMLGMYGIHDVYNRLPPLAGPFPPPTGDQGTCFFHVLPFVEQDNVWKESADEAGIHSPWNNGIYGKDLFVSYYRCPADRSGAADRRYQGWLATSNYAANFLVFGDPDSYSMQGSPRIPNSFPDGLSTTIALAERYQICNGEPNAWPYDGTSAWTPAFAFTSTGRPQIKPEPTQCDPSLPQSPHGTGSNVGLADGSVRHLSPSVSARTWRAACTPAGGEPPGGDF
jgi:prepilin-type processing-associated H-X9-DG protein